MAIPEPMDADKIGIARYFFLSKVMFSFRLRRGFKKYDSIPVVFSINLSKYLMKPAAPQIKFLFEAELKSFLNPLIPLSIS